MGFRKLNTYLNFPEYPTSNPYYNHIIDFVLKAVVKYEYHNSVKAIERALKWKDLFNFSNVKKRKFFGKLSV